MSEFQKWFNKIIKRNDYLGSDLSLMAWDHQQQKIDLMQKMIDLLKNYDVEFVTEEIKQLEKEFKELGYE